MYIYIYIILKIKAKIHTIGFPLFFIFNNWLDICITQQYYIVRGILSKYFNCYPMNLTKFWKIFLLSLISVLFVGFVGGGVYIYLKDPFGFKVPKLDKYSDVLDWCGSRDKNDILNLDCKALLLDITVGESNKSCFDMLVITRDKGLKELTVCEPTGNLTYTNEILGYKKLMPISMNLTYSKDNILNSYAFSNVSFEDVDEEYIHDIVNEDIANLVQTDVESVTTIKNSVNFCPQPEQLPDYITAENKIAYGNFYKNKLMNSDSYDIGGLYSLEDDSINILLICNLQTAINNTEFCKNLDIDIDDNIRKEIKTIAENRGKYRTATLTTTDVIILKDITLLNTSTKGISFSNPSSALFSTLKTLTSNSGLNIATFYSVVNILTQIDDSQNMISADIGRIKENITVNIVDLTSALSLPLINKENVDSDGLYLQLYGNYRKQNENLEILNNCMNLYVITQ